ncbi:MAG: methyl-accepting chemotaxis protein, partial [Lachnospiraceae bacterium]|nr:methyl-accepting chemotaxis protein [Lachnospiraceae bacterium]
MEKKQMKEDIRNDLNAIKSDFKEFRTMVRSKSKLNFYLLLALYALVPLATVVLALGSIITTVTKKNIRNNADQAMMAVIEEVGSSFDYFVEQGNTTVKAYATAPIVKEFLQNPDDKVLAEKAQNYTVDFFAALDGWEGIYIADWNSKVLTHPAAPVIGKVMREGERLAELQNDMLSADGVLNYGLITSPASGELIISMYYAITDDNGTPIGYVGAGSFVNPICDAMQNVSTLGFESAYIYFVDTDGTIVYHKNKDVIGTQTESQEVLRILDNVNNGKEFDAYTYSYEYRGKDKHAAFHVGANKEYVTIITTDDADIIANVNQNSMVVVTFGFLGVVIFGIFSLFAGRIITNPLRDVSEAALKMAEGNTLVELKSKSRVRETVNLVNAFEVLRDNTRKAISDVHTCVNSVNEQAKIVADRTEGNTSDVEDINFTVEEVAKTSQHVAEAAMVMTERSEEIGHSIDE